MAHVLGGHRGKDGPMSVKVSLERGVCELWLVPKKKKIHAEPSVAGQVNRPHCEFGRPLPILHIFSITWHIVFG